MYIVTNYNYQFSFWDDHNFSTGFALGLNSMTIPGEDGPTNFGYVSSATIGPIYKLGLNAGLAYQYKNLSAGLSMTNINEPVYTETGTYWDFQYPEHSHFFAYAMYKIQIKNDWKLIPTLFFIDTDEANQFDFNTRIYYKDRYFLGISYDYYNSFAFQGGLEFWERLNISYCYESNRRNDFNRYNYDAHGISLAFSIDKD